MPASQEMPLAFRIQEFIQARGYAVGAAGSDARFGYQESTHTLGAGTKAFFIFKPIGFWRGLLREPPCIAMLNASRKEWYLQIYGRQYSEEMEALAALLTKEFRVQTYSKILSDEPRNA
jgi:hypothetical protein